MAVVGLPVNAPTSKWSRHRGLHRCQPHSPPCAESHWNGQAMSLRSQGVTGGKDILFAQVESSHGDQVPVWADPFLLPSGSRQCNRHGRPAIPSRHTGTVGLLDRFALISEEQPHLMADA